MTRHFGQPGTLKGRVEIIEPQDTPVRYGLLARLWAWVRRFGR